MIDAAAWSWPQYTYLAILLIGLGISLADHGKPQTGSKNFFVTAIAAGLLLTLLAFGGFFGRHS